MRILVISDLPQFVTGGAEAQAARLIEAWMDSGHEVVCLGRRMRGDAITLGAHAIKVHRIRTFSILGRWGRALTYFVALALLLLRYRGWADVIYTRFLGEAATTAALLKSARLLRAPLVATPASSSSGGDVQHIQSTPFGRWVTRVLERQCDAINLIADSMEGELRGAGFSGRTFTRIPNGIPIDDLPSRPASCGLNIVSVGRLDRQKGLDVLLRAISRLRELPEPRIRVIGGGPELSSLRTLARDLEVSDAVEWLGELRPDAVVHRLNEANLFVLPSRFEGMSNAGLEAMERGLPMIITRCGGLDRYISADIGWVVPVEDDVALANAIESAMAAGAEKLAAMGQASRACVQENFEIRQIATRYLQLFQALLENRAHGVPQG